MRPALSGANECKWGGCTRVALQQAGQRCAGLATDWTAVDTLMREGDED